MVRVAYQGEPGAFSEAAALDFFGSKLSRNDLVPCTTFKAVFDALMQDKADRAVLPIENMLAGTIHSNLDLIIKHHQIHIIGELDVHVRHCLLAAKGVALEDVKVVRSHPMALDQCRGFLQEKGLTSEVAYDTAGSAKRIVREGLRDSAAIASRAAAEIYDLQVLDDKVADTENNYTRFWVLSKTIVEYEPHVPSKTSIAFTFNNHVGKLYQALGCLSSNDIDLTKIECRHIYSLGDALITDQETAQRWGYIFYIDFVGSVAERSIELALESLKLKTAYFRLLGSYRRHDLAQGG